MQGIDLEAHLLAGGNEAGRSRGYEIDRHGSLPEPSDEDMEGVLERVRLSKVLERIRLRAGLCTTHFHPGDARNASDSGSNFGSQTTSGHISHRLNGAPPQHTR